MRPSTRVIVDCTIGTGGHAEQMLQASSEECILFGIDLDEQALRIARERLSQFKDRVFLKKMNFRDLLRAIPPEAVGRVDALLIDCGISKLQIVTSDRGFSFDRDGALDMRFDTSAGKTAATVLATTNSKELKDILIQFGEKARAGRIARAIVRLREQGRLRSTLDLAKAVKSVVRSRTAKSLARVFLAVRAQVNNELDSLAEVLDVLPEVLSPQGRAAVISYHSGEDRLVKTAFRKFSGKCICPPERVICDCGRRRLLRILTPKPILPTAAEIAINPSARSARMRMVEKM